MCNTKSFVFVMCALMFGVTVFSAAAQEALYVDTESNVAVTRALAFDADGDGVDESDSTYDAMPIGAIIMYDGAGWVDDETIPGWFACTEENSQIPPDSPIGAIVGIPNLEDHFIIGVAPDALEAYVDDRFGGSNEVTLTEAQMPSHAHGIDHNHDSVSFQTDQAGAHSHGLAGTGWGSSNTDGLPTSGTVAGRYLGRTGWYRGFVQEDGSHRHTVNVDLPATSGMVSASTGGDQPFDNRPAYYSVIFIRKSYQPIAR